MDMLSKEQRSLLLKIARESIRQYMETGDLKKSAPDTNDAVLLEPAAVFVTLHIGKNLRGCIGTTEPGHPLIQAVAYYAAAAAFRDPRFPQLGPDELPRTHIEISVLSKPERVKNADAIKPGVHGVVVSNGGRAGLFLPQVWEVLPDKESFMEALCREKAGLAADAWKKPGTDISIFTVESFEEQGRP